MGTCGGDKGELDAPIGLFNANTTAVNRREDAARQRGIRDSGLIHEDSGEDIRVSMSIDEARDGLPCAGMSRIR